VSHPPGLRLHPRTMPVRSAGIHFRDYVNRFQDERGLTDIEMAQILTESLQIVLKYMLRAERHPDDPDHKADEA
jgi:hypothetical protein